MKTQYVVLVAILFILLGMVPGLAIALSTNITNDHSALLAIKFQLSLDPSHNLPMNWSDSTSICNWIGVTCGSRHHRVTGLDLSCMNLTAGLPQQIGNLSFLVSLNLSSNNLFGNIPREITRLRRLRILDFSFNNLHGEIPSWFNFLSKLEILYLRNNSFTGFIPPFSNMSNIEALDFSSNALQGGIPKELGDLLHLKMLVLNRNQLSDAIPWNLFNMSTLERLDLTLNSLHGTLPDNMCIGAHSRLEELRLPGNDLNGQILPNLSNCSRLRILSLSYNHFSGSIPRGIGNMKQLELLYLGSNNFTGQIPDELSNITTLRELDFPDNHITGSITAKTFNISSLQYLNCGRNNLSGTLPTNMCAHLKQLQEAYFDVNHIYGSIPTRLYECSALRVLQLPRNQLSGVLPKEIGNITLLQQLYLDDNKLTGAVPREIGNLVNLEAFVASKNQLSGHIPPSIFNISMLRLFSLGFNQLVGNLPPDLGLGLQRLEVIILVGNNLTSASTELRFLTSLTNCKNLRTIQFNRNPLNGVLPSSIGNLSTSLQFLSFNGCGLKGSIPNEIGNLSNVIGLSLGRNYLAGKLPTNLANLKSLQGIEISDNKISGTIPNNICELENLNTVYLDGNLIYGSIPRCIGSITTLRYLNLSTNNLNSTIPVSLWHITDLLQLDFSFNHLTGFLPVELGNLRSIDSIDFSYNQLSSIIPSVIGNLQELGFLSLAHNILQGSIPDTIAKMVNLEFLDLSRNNLSGKIPASLENLTHLNYLNVSFNGLSGEIPSGGAFENFTSQSFICNKGLCGDRRYNVTPCHETKSKGKWKHRVIFVIVGALAFLVVIILFAYVFARDRMKNKSPNISNIWMGPTQMRISYYELLEATDRYNESNLIGNGSFGSVYKGTLRNGKAVAVKVFHEQRDGVADSFELECEVLKKLRHRNLCKVIGCCSNQDFKALILDYMPSGSLEKLLYSTNFSLDLVQRINIMIDVASALGYLHYDYSTPIVHCDLKPSNILLDENMVGHLCDFGLAKILGNGDSVTHTMTLATLGYMAPEFGTDGCISIRSDVYSYGITLMEVFTRRKPNDEFFIGDLSLRSWVEASLADSFFHIIDQGIMQVEEEEERYILKLNCVHAIMELAMQCTCESPNDRINIKDVNAYLKKIRNQLL